MKQESRGVRNNNPLNIRKSAARWYGKIEGADPEFETFDCLINGFRAAFINIHTHIKQSRKILLPTTLASEITKWAPASENDTARYIKIVSTIANVKPDQVLDFRNKKMMCAVVSAMARVECGYFFDAKVISIAYDLAEKSI